MRGEIFTDTLEITDDLQKYAFCPISIVENAFSSASRCFKVRQGPYEIYLSIHNPLWSQCSLHVSLHAPCIKYLKLCRGNRIIRWIRLWWTHALFRFEPDEWLIFLYAIQRMFSNQYPATSISLSLFPLQDLQLIRNLLSRVFYTSAYINAGIVGLVFGLHAVFLNIPAYFDNF